MYQILHLNRWQEKKGRGQGLPGIGRQKKNLEKRGTRNKNPILYMTS